MDLNSSDVKRFLDRSADTAKDTINFMKDSARETVNVTREAADNAKGITLIGKCSGNFAIHSNRKHKDLAGWHFGFDKEIPLLKVLGVLLLAATVLYTFCSLFEKPSSDGRS